VPRSRLILLFLLVPALVVGAFTAAAGAGQDAKKKPINSCSLITIEELEVLFEQPFRNGVQESGGSCVFRRPSDSPDLPDIIVTVLARRLSTVAKAKQEFVEARNVSTQLSGEITRVPRLGDQAFATVLIGADLLTLRVNRVVADIRVDQNDDPDARFAEQIVGVAQAVVTHLAAA
jgi:hypothetical protein